MWSTRILEARGFPLGPIESSPPLGATDEAFACSENPVMRIVLPDVMVNDMVEDGRVVFEEGAVRLSMMIVWSLPVVEAPPVVAEIAPAPWIVTEVVKVPFRAVPPVQVQVPAGIVMMS